MNVELHLPDLPEVAISVGAEAGAPRRPRAPWHLRLRDALSAYLPLLLMALLALGTWWLVKNTPGAPAARDAQTQRQDPDYTMSRFTLERFAPDGRLRVRIEGRELRHYPGDDRIEIDEVQVHALTGDGRAMQASARRAVSNSSATELRLHGGAEVNGTDAAGQPVLIRSEFLHAQLDPDIVRSHLPVQVQQGRNSLRAGGLVFDASRQMLDLSGPVRAVLQAPAR